LVQAPCQIMNLYRSIHSIIIADKYDNKENLQDLYKYLASFGLNKYIHFDSLDDLKENLNFLKDEMYCFFSNPYYRIKEYEMSQTLSILKNNAFKGVAFEKQIVFFYKNSLTRVARDTLYFDCNTAKSEEYFTVRNSSFIYKTPNIPPPRIICYTYNRDVYLRLTLNSLMSSLEHCPDVPVTIVLNAPTDKVKEVALDFMHRFKQIEVLLVNKNVAFAGVNVAVQWYKPESFILSEDDFILPGSVKSIYPMWPYQFVERLDHFKTVGWLATLDNIPFNGCHEWAIPSKQSNSGYYYNLKLPMMAQLLCVKTDYWKSKIDMKAFMSFDNALNIETTASPRLCGYHIGFNEKNDDYFFDKHPAFNISKENEIVDVINLKTTEKRVIDLKDIIK